VVGTAAVSGSLTRYWSEHRRRAGISDVGLYRLLFAITQIGAPFLIVIWGGAAWWLFGHKHQAWVIVVWGLFVSSIDNLIKALAHRL
jgi:hypothetical protein